MKQSWIVFVIVFLLAGCAATAGKKPLLVPIDNLPQRGPADAPVTIVEFSDYT